MKPELFIVANVRDSMKNEHSFRLAGFLLQRLRDRHEIKVNPSSFLMLIPALLAFCPLLSCSFPPSPFLLPIVIDQSVIQGVREKSFS
jgi:hypothetical protein